MNWPLNSCPVCKKTLAANSDAVVAITSNGKPVMALVPWETWQETEDMAAALETLEVLADPDTMAAIKQAEAGIASGKLISGDPALQQLSAEGLIDPDRI